MDFARKLLSKYGWKEGDGLGKKNDGISKPLKANLKFDNAGLGADQAASDFNNHWWERVFDEAAQNVEVQKESSGAVSMMLKNDDAVEISTKGYSLKKLKKAKKSSNDGANSTQYNNFLQSATLTNSGTEIENPNKVALDNIEVTQIKVLSDEELFKACGGRTAHKGARHGLKLSGKLSRLEQQEKDLLDRMQQSKARNNSIEKSEIVATEDDSKLDNVEKVRSKKKKRKAENSEELLNAEQNNDDDVHKTNKECKKKKKDKTPEAFLEEENVLQAHIKKSKKKKNKNKHDK